MNIRPLHIAPVPWHPARAAAPFFVERLPDLAHLPAGRAARRPGRAVRVVMISDWPMACGGPSIMGSESESCQKMGGEKSTTPHIRDRVDLATSQVVGSVSAQTPGAADQTGFLV